MDLDRIFGRCQPFWNRKVAFEVFVKDWYVLLRHTFQLISTDLGMDCFKFEGEVSFQTGKQGRKQGNWRSKLGETKSTNFFQISGSLHFWTPDKNQKEKMYVPGNKISFFTHMIISALLPIWCSFCISSELQESKHGLTPGCPHHTYPQWPKNGADLGAREEFGPQRGESMQE